MDNIRYIIECDCGADGISVTHAYEDDGVYMETYISHWLYGKWDMGLKEKIKYCWHILTTGNVYADMVCLSNDNRKRLINALRDIEEK